MITPIDNPYIGPKTFTKEYGEYFFGRDREARTLSALVLTERLVLFYAQSGAGKSSLINTRLIPELESEENLYEVLPVARVGGSLPKEITLDEGDKLKFNIYVFNLISSLTTKPEFDPGSLVKLTLPQFMGRLTRMKTGISTIQIWQRSCEETLRNFPGAAH